MNNGITINTTVSSGGTISSTYLPTSSITSTVVTGGVGQGVPRGGTAGQFYVKNSSADYDGSFRNILESDVTNLPADLAANATAIAAETARAEAAEAAIGNKGFVIAMAVAL